MVQLGLLIAGMFLLQAVLSVLQMRHFSREFMKLRRRGKVACGRQAGGFHAGAIVMFLLNENGVIQEGKKLFGVTCFARVTALPGFEGKYVGGLTEADCRNTAGTCARPFWTLGIPITNLSPARRFPSRPLPSNG